MIRRKLPTSDATAFRTAESARGGDALADPAGSCGYMYRDFRDPVFISYFRAPPIHMGGRNARWTMRRRIPARFGASRHDDAFRNYEDNAFPRQ